VKPTGTEVPDAALVAQDMSSIKHIMWNYVGLVRTTRRLARAIQTCATSRSRSSVSTARPR